MDLFAKLVSTPLLKQAREEGIYPFFHVLESRQDAEVIMEGKRRIMLGSNNYLGLTVHPDVVAAAHQALDKYGSGCSGSRYLNGTLDLHLQLEQELAAFTHKEAAMIFSTGFQTNLGAISTLVGRHDYLICDMENHASIYDGCKLSYGKMLRYRHNDMEDLERKLAQVPPEAGALIISDGVFSMGGDICDLPNLVRLKQKYGARLMLDDAHGFGVLGALGEGTAAYFGLAQEVDIIMSTFSKSLASLGGFIAADAAVIDYIRHASRPFIFSASIPPANAAAALAALNVLKQNPDLPRHLLELADYLRARLREHDVPMRESATPIVPVFTFTPLRTLKINRRLFDEGVYVNVAFPPATAPDECLLRLSLTACLNHALIDEAVGIIVRVLAEFPPEE